MGKKVQAKIPQVPNNQIAWFNFSRQILGNPLIIVCALTDSNLFCCFVFDIITIVKLDARNTRIATTTFKRRRQFFVDVYLRTIARAT